MNINTTVPIVIPVDTGGGGSAGCGGYYEKWIKFADGSWRCTPLKWEEMDEYLTWRWWHYKVYLPVGIPCGIIGGILLIIFLCFALGAFINWYDERKERKIYDAYKGK